MEELRSPLRPPLSGRVKGVDAKAGAMNGIGPGLAGGRLEAERKVIGLGSRMLRAAPAWMLPVSVSAVAAEVGRTW